MKYILNIAILFCIVYFISCDKISPPYKNDISDIKTDTAAHIRKILIEDFTGHRCGNCPRAREQIDTLQKLYGEKIISIGVHAGSFASPNASEGFTADYRTTFGSKLALDFGVSAYPSGMVSRSVFNGKKVLTYSEWGSAMGAIVNLAPEADIKIENLYNQNSRVLTVKVRTDLLKDTSRILNLAVYLVEDSIKSQQLDYSLDPPEIPDYIHRHVLRAAINGTYGEQIFSGAIKKGQFLEKVYSYTLKSTWKESNCIVIAYIFDATTKEILQVEENGDFYIAL